MAITKIYNMAIGINLEVLFPATSYKENRHGTKITKVVVKEKYESESKEEDMRQWNGRVKIKRDGDIMWEFDEELPKLSVKIIEKMFSPEEIVEIFAKLKKSKVIR